MARCLSCGRRVRGPHAPCGEGPQEPAAGSGLPLPDVPGYPAVRLLGRGGFGLVLEAVREESGERAAVKVARLDVPEARAQLARELEALQAVGRQAAPALIDAGALADGAPFIAMELVNGPSLAERMTAAGGPLPPAELAAIARPLLEALAVVHAAGFAHGDLKPENVLLETSPLRARESIPGPSRANETRAARGATTARSSLIRKGGATKRCDADRSIRRREGIVSQALRARLLDFGLSERLGDPRPSTAGARRGTAEYMAPEQCEGQPPDARSDLYAVGCILFELATGRPPFFGDPADVRHAHVNLRPPRPSSLAEVPPALEQAILRCLAKSPPERYPSASALWEALALALSRPADPAPARTVPVAPPAPAAARVSRRRVGILFLETSGSPVALQGLVASLGGVLAHSAGGRSALVFDPLSGDNPVRLAVGAARSVVARGVAPRALVDLVEVTVRSRPGGRDRYLSAAFTQRDAWPREDDPPGVLGTAEAMNALPGLRFGPVPGRPGLCACLGEFEGEESTTANQEGAGPLLGREAVLSELLELARGALDGRPTVVAVLGEEGIGKSHLAAVLAGRLRGLAPAPRVVELRAQDAAEAGEGATMRALLRQVLDLAPAAPPPVDGGRAALLAALPGDIAEEAWSAIALALGWLSIDSPHLASRLAAPGAMASMVLRAAGTVLRHRAASHPVCLLLDDAHLCGGLLLDTLEFSALAEGGAPILACALARPRFAATRPGWGERAARSRTIRLEALGPDHARELCRSLLRPAESVPARAVDILVGRTRGIPSLLVELVRRLKADGLLRKHPGAESYFLATDELGRMVEMPAVEWIASRALQGLPEELVPHAQLAALLADEIGPDETSGVLAELEAAGLGATFPLDGRAATRRLVRAGLLASHRGGRTSFRLPLVRDAVARSAPDPLRLAVHEAARRCYERPGSCPEEERRARLLRHAEASGRREQAAALSLLLAEEARARHAYLAAESLYTRALGQLPDAPSRELVAAHRGRGLMRYRLGRYEDSVGDLAAARAVARAVGDVREEVECLLDEATALDWMVDYEGSRERFRAAETLAPAPSVAQRARLELARGRSLFRSGQWAGAASALEAAAASAVLLGEAGYETLVVALLMLGTVLPPLGRPAEAAAALARARDLARSRGDDLHLSAICMNERNLLVAKGDLEGAIASQREAARLGRELGMAGNEYYGECNAAELYYQAGDLASAERHVRRAVEIERRHPEVAPTPMAVLLSARLLLAAGDVDGARRRHEEFRDLLARARRSGRRGADLAPNEQVLADMVDLATRDASDEEWETLLARSAAASIEQEPIEVLETRGLAAARSGRAEVARQALEGALRLAADIPNLMVERLRRGLASLGGPPA